MDKQRVFAVGGRVALPPDELAAELARVRAAVGVNTPLRWRIGLMREVELARDRQRWDAAYAAAPGPDAPPTLHGVPCVRDVAEPARLRLEACVAGTWIIIDTRGPQPGGGWAYAVAEPLPGDWEQ